MSAQKRPANSNIGCRSDTQFISKGREQKVMALNEEKRGMLPQIIVAVVVALLVGGTSPWWWNEIFHKNNGVNPPPSSPPVDPKPPQIPVQSGQIQVRCTSSPHSIPAGGKVEIRILAFTEQNSPVSGASVRIEAGGGWFSSSGTTAEIGQTDSGGVFMTRWRAPKPAARGYGMGATVNKNGFTEGMCEVNVPIQ